MFIPDVTLKAVLVPALFLAHLTEPAQLLQPLRLHLVGQPLRASNVVLRHPEASLDSLVDLEVWKHANREAGTYGGPIQNQKQFKK